MHKYFALQGVGHFTRPDFGDSPSAWKKWPYIVVVGPSGQLVQLQPPSGLSGSDEAVGWAHSLHNFEGTLSHKPLAFVKNKLVSNFRSKLNSTDSLHCLAWSPEPQPSGQGAIKNDNFQIDTNIDMDNDLIFDGTNWEVWGPKIGNIGSAVLYQESDSVVWFMLDDSSEPMIFGDYKLEIPKFIVETSQSGYKPPMGNYGNPGDAGDAGWSRWTKTTQSFGEALTAGVDFDVGNGAYPSDISFSPCDIVKHKDTYYVIGQFYIFAATLGTKGSFIHHDFGVDSKIDDFGGTTEQNGLEGYSQRFTTGQIGGYMKSAAVHNDKIWLLQNNGKIFEIRPGGIVEKADLSQIGTPWGSGIFGGHLQRTPLSAAGDLPSPQNFRPFLASFNKQLHAFLNFRTSFRIGKGTTSTQGQGVAWFTSHDGINWQDRSEMLPVSGIQTPSGNAVQIGSWLSQISPYRFSALQNTSYPSGYGNGSPISGGIESNPSGFKQSDLIPFWSSGSLIDAAGTSFGNLNTPLEFGTISGYLFPTFVSYPSGFAGIHPSGFAFGLLPLASGGVWGPVPGGTSGYDYTGCFNHHIAGYVDTTDPQDHRLKLCFSRNFPGGTAVDPDQIPSLFYDLNKSSGWIQRNEAVNVGQLNGFIPIDLHDPEILIPSGHFIDINPNIDTVNKRVKIDFQTIDWGFWDKVNIRVEYSLDGSSWATATTSGNINNLSTGTKQTDPSGVGKDINSIHSMYWLYDRDLSKNQFFPNVSIRMRPEI